MKKFWSDFFLRGFVAAAGGPVVLAIIYGIWGKTGVVNALSPHEVCMGILTITLLAMVVGGMTAIYQVEQLPLISAILIHGGVLYGVYILVYLINGWLISQLIPILVFTGVFVAGYTVIWLCIYLYHRKKITAINRNLKG